MQRAEPFADVIRSMILGCTIFGASEQLVDGIANNLSAAAEGLARRVLESGEDFATEKSARIVREVCYNEDNGAYLLISWFTGHAI